MYPEGDTPCQAQIMDGRLGVEYDKFTRGSTLFVNFFIRGAEEGLRGLVYGAPVGLRADRAAAALTQVIV